MHTPPSSRENLVELLRDFPIEAERESEIRERTCELVVARERCADRDHFEPGHLTGSAWIVDASGAKALLLHHRKLERWLQPGGHADGEFDLASVALREAREETGLSSVSLVSPAIFDIDIHSIPPRGGEPAHLHFDLRFLFRADAHEPLSRNHESRGLAWIAMEDLSRYTNEESIHRMRRRAERLIADPL